jgi:hypothetical protein
VEREFGKGTQYIMFTALPARGFMMAWKDKTIGEQKKVAFNSKPGFNPIPSRSF